MRHTLLASLLIIAPMAVAASPPAQFAMCGVCHAVKAGAPAGGAPNLAGVYNRKIAGVAGYAYSPGLKAKAGKWTDAALDAYIAAPATFAPGTKMAYAGQHDAAARKAIIAYLKSLK